MKIYTSTFDLAYPSNARFWVAPNSDFKIGLKIVNKGEDYTGNFALKSGSTTFTPDASKTAGFTTYTIKSLGAGAVTYEIDVPGAQQKFTLMQIVTDSTVFEVGALSGGGDVPADVATQTWVNEQISSFVEEDDLTGYATKDELTSKADVSSLTAYATTDDLTAYATQNDLTSKADVSSLTAYAEVTSLTSYATKNDLTAKADVSSLTAYAEVTSLTAYATQNDLTSKADVSSLTAYATTDDLSTAVSNKIDYVDSEVGAPDILHVTSMFESDWESLSADADENTFYVIIADPE